MMSRAEAAATGDGLPTPPGCKWAPPAALLATWGGDGSSSDLAHLLALPRSVARAGVLALLTCGGGVGAA